MTKSRSRSGAVRQNPSDQHGGIPLLENRETLRQSSGQALGHPSCCGADINYRCVVLPPDVGHPPHGDHSRDRISLILTELL